MEYLLVMSLSGSTMTGIYLLLRCLLRSKGCARSYYWFAKAAVLYYLIPLPFVKKWYREVLRVILPEGRMESVQIPLRWTNYVVYGQERRYLNIYARLQMTVIIVWLSVACLLLLRQMVEYFQSVRLIARYAHREMTSRQKAVLELLQKEYRVKRKVVVYQGQDGEPTMTFGLFRPVILCGRDLESREAMLLLRHEMVHIKRWDVFWKILMHLVTFLHWWNLIMWILYRNFERDCEWSCDEAAMQDRPKEEVKEYLRLLVEEARDGGRFGGSSKRASLRWRADFGNSAKKLKERIENLMKRRKWNKVAAGILVTVLAFANSMTVFAYRDVVQQEVPEGTSAEDIEEILHRNSLVFVPDGVDVDVEQMLAQQDTAENIVIQYDRQFVDTEGNIYPIPDAGVYRGCTHDYVSGTEIGHTKHSDGGCLVVVYSSKRCSKCGYIVQGDEISRTYYKVCPH